MSVYNLKSDRPMEVVTSDPLETVRTYLEMRWEQENSRAPIGNDVASFARRGRQAEVRLTDLSALVAEVDRLRAHVAGHDGAIASAFERGRLSGLGG